MFNDGSRPPGGRPIPGALINSELPMRILLIILVVVAVLVVVAMVMRRR